MRIFAVLAALAVMAIVPSVASAGNLLATGHDADLHCAGASPPENWDQCHYVQVAVNFVRSGAPDRNKPVLILTNRDKQAEVALDKAFPPGSVPRTVVDPRSPEFATTPLSTANWSAIIVGSDYTCGGCDLNESDSTPDSDAINARSRDIAAFFNQGGGIYVNAGADHGDGDPGNGADVFYNFVPINLGAVAVSAPFKLTPDGQALGFVDDQSGNPGTFNDINCCATHNSFNIPPPGSALRVAETDSAGKAETLFTSAQIIDGQFSTPPTRVPPDAIGLRKKKCIDRRKFSFRLRNAPGRKAVRVEVKINRKKRLITGSDIKRVTIKRLPKGKTYKVSILVTQDDGSRRISQRKYKGCKKSRPKTRRVR